MPIRVAKSIAPSASSTVAGNRSRISSVIGRRDAMLVPRSPSRDRLEVPPVLDVDRVVEPVLVTDLRDRLVRRPLAQQRLGG